MPDDVDDDLRDVFQALYDGDEWEDWADDVSYRPCAS